MPQHLSLQECKIALKEIGPYLECKNVNVLIQKFLLQDARLHYGEFINSVCKALVIIFDTIIVIIMLTQ